MDTTINMSRYVGVLAVTIGVLVIVVALFIANPVDISGTEFSSQKLVKSVEIKAGDTLWSIAEENQTIEYSDIRDYIKEIKEANGLSSDKIREGSFIIVPYYEK